jgi:hypothetical protein
MLQKKDKEKVLDEVWTETHIKSFLDLVPPTGIDADFHALSTAYKAMRLNDFSLFVDMFAESKRNFSAKNASGQTVLDIIRQHRKGAGYAEILTGKMGD